MTQRHGDAEKKPINLSVSASKLLPDDRVIQAAMALRSVHDKKTITVVVMRNKKETPITVTIENAGATGRPVRAEVRPAVGPISGVHFDAETRRRREETN